ncbi:MAG: GlmU family protein [Taibaiella sp.]|nr:GlmU family protein [Taibaiella sp.]
MDFVLFDDEERNLLFPFTHTRPVADIRCGIWTIREKWEYLLEGKAAFRTAPYLMQAFNPGSVSSGLKINGSLLPDDALVRAVQSLSEGHALVKDGKVVAIHGGGDDHHEWQPLAVAESLETEEYPYPVSWIRRPWDIFSHNDRQIQSDFLLLTQGKKSQAIPGYVTAIAPENIYIEEGATLLPCILNAAHARIYIGRNAEIMEGSMLRGNIAICDQAVVKMGAKVYSGTTIGPGCKVGGEIQNTIFFANSNKGHDGYLGNAVIGEWCNLGADTNCSNLKNDYGQVDAYSEGEGKYIETGLQFCGLMMGDHSKCSINTMFNTGTVVGVSCNIFGTDFPPKFIPSFSWGGSQQLKVYKIEKAKRTANSMMERRHLALTEAEESIFQYIFEHSPVHLQKK